ncbi:hypothetical protein RvY_16743 [Ramazzottius varieornatus]|uniref:Lipocalin/cytosolic fatty-acid binding domain-containing protein n=1 Tax=Ramazzottius varieornatus TaxID=947166 RepID=A0A1D1VZL8_RAMVA|nr:hypothetical protein RvY_16743 [Ramazzottius varieornatus]
MALSFAVLASVLFISITRGQRMSTKKCGIPLDIPGMNGLEVEKMAGTWYEYMYVTPGIDDANAVNTYTVLGTRTKNPLVVAMEWRSQSLVFNLKPTEPYSCFPIFQTADFTGTGMKLSEAWRTSTATNSSKGSFAILFTDYTMVEITTRCLKPNANATFNLCDVPMFFVNTRVMPPKLDAATKAYIKSAINRQLNKYCFADMDLHFTVWDTTKMPFPPCKDSEAVPPVPFTAKIEAVKKEVQANNGGAAAPSAPMPGAPSQEAPVVPGAPAPGAPRPAAPQPGAA